MNVRTAVATVTAALATVAAAVLLTVGGAGGHQDSANGWQSQAAPVTVADGQSTAVVAAANGWQ